MRTKPYSISILFLASSNACAFCSSYPFSRCDAFLGFLKSVMGVAFFYQNWLTNAMSSMELIFTPMQHECWAIFDVIM